MDDSLDDLLGRAGIEVIDEPQVSAALTALLTVRATEGRTLRKKRRFVLPAVTIGGLLALAGAGAAIATQWGPWIPEVADPDIVFSRDWYDVAGDYLGYCEGRLVTTYWDEGTVDAARAYYRTLDADALEPDRDSVALALWSQGELDRIGELISGASAEDFDVEPKAPADNSPKIADARILHNALMTTVYSGMTVALHDGNISSAGEVKCTTDSVDSANQ